MQSNLTCDRYILQLNVQIGMILETDLSINGQLVKKKKKKKPCMSEFVGISNIFSFICQHFRLLYAVHTRVESTFLQDFQ